MSDNTAVTNGTGDVYRSKDRAGVKTDIVGIDVGIGGTESLMSPTNPMPTFHPDITTSGSLAALNATLALALSGQSSGSIQITGTFVGTITFETQRDGATWTAFNAVQAGSTALTQSTTGPGLFSVNVAARASFRVNMSAFTSGSAVVTMGASHATGAIYSTQVLPVAGAGVAGTPSAGVVSVQGVASGTVLPVSLATNTPTLAAGTNVVGAFKKAPATTGTITSPALAVTSFTVLAANTNRLGATVFNDSGNTLYLALAAAASTTSFTVQVLPAGYYELPNDGCGYTGIITAISLAASGNARVTELT